LANKSTIEGEFLAVHMDIWINCAGLTVRTGTAAVWVCGKWGGDVGVGQQGGPELGQDLVEGLARVETEN